MGLSTILHNYNTPGQHVFNRPTEDPIAAATGVGNPTGSGYGSSPPLWLFGEKKEAERRIAGQKTTKSCSETKSDESFKLPPMTIVLAIVFVVLVCGIAYSSVSRTSQPVEVDIPKMQPLVEKPKMLNSGVDVVPRQKPKLIEVVKPKVIAAHEARESSSRESSGLRSRKSMCTAC